MGDGWTRTENKGAPLKDLKRKRAKGRCHLAAVPADLARFAFNAPPCPNDGQHITVVLFADGGHWSQVVKPAIHEEG